MAMRLHWQVHPGTGPYLLLVHGFLMGPNQWHPNLAALSAVCQPVVVDLLGHGRSPAPEDASCYQPSAYVETFETIRQALGTERWLLCGYSLGAGLTMRYALLHPHRIIGHAFTNSTSALADAEQVALWQAEGEASAGRILAGGRKAIERIPVHPRFAKR
ncbi:MAG: alpha/beta fold hydrolase, partial [Gammaproteobacteria bacterium]|nr:alpha/beta fold hydrolase [Gammaproteobacteria bacterium]